MHGLDEIEEIVNGFKDEMRLDIIQYYCGLFEDHLKGKSVISNREINVLASICKMKDEFSGPLVETVLDKKIDQVQTYILNNNKADFREEKKHFSRASKWMKTVAKDIKNTFGFDEVEYKSDSDSEAYTAKTDPSEVDRDEANQGEVKANKNEEIGNQKESRNESSDQSSNDSNEFCPGDAKLSDSSKDPSKTRIELCTKSEKDDGNLVLFRNFNEKFGCSIVSIFFSVEKFSSSGNQLLIDLYFYKNSFGKIKDPSIEKLIDKVSGNFGDVKVLNEAEIMEIIKNS